MLLCLWMTFCCGDEELRDSRNVGGFGLRCYLLSGIVAKNKRDLLCESKEEMGVR